VADRHRTAATGDYYAARDTVTPFLRSAGVTELAGVLISHPHADHFAGLPYIMENFKIGQLVDAGYEEIGGSELETYRKIRAEAVTRGRSGCGSAGVEGGDGCGARGGGAVAARGLHRPDPTRPDDAAYNANSIVLRVRHGANVLLFPGDHHGIVDLAKRVGQEKLNCALLVTRTRPQFDSGNGGGDEAESGGVGVSGKVRRVVARSGEADRGGFCRGGVGGVRDSVAWRRHNHLRR